MSNSIYHPMLNSTGVYKASDEKHWYETSVVLESVADCYKVDNIGTTVSRPDGQDRGKNIYPSQFRDLRYSANAVSYHDTASKEFSDGVSGKGGICDTVGMITITEQLGNDNTSATYLSLPLSSDKPIVGSAVYHNGDTARVLSVKLSSGGTAWTVWLVGTIDRKEHASITYVKQLPITQSNGEQFCTDTIGSPTNYPTIMKDRLAEGRTIVGLNPLLVSDSGESLIPDGSIDKFKLSAKMKSYDIGIVTDDNGTNYHSVPRITRATENDVEWTNCPTYRVALNSYTAAIPVATIQDLKPVEYVLEKYCASNSHSIYKGNNITGLIGVGTGDDMESGYLGDCDNPYVLKITSSINYAGVQTYFYCSSSLKLSSTGIGVTYGNDGKKYKIERTEPYNNGTKVFLLKEYGDLKGKITSYAESVVLYGILNTPTNQTINLSNTGDKASKAFLTIASDSDGELYAQWMVEELKGDGDTGDFSQLTNGTKEDFNGNICRTVVASRALNLLKEDK